MKTQDRFFVNEAGDDIDLAVISPFKVTRITHNKLKALSVQSGYKISEIIRQMIVYSLANMDPVPVKVKPIKIKMGKRGRPTLIERNAKRRALEEEERAAKKSGKQL